MSYQYGDKFEIKGKMLIEIVGVHPEGQPFQLFIDNEKIYKVLLNGRSWQFPASIIDSLVVEVIEKPIEKPVEEVIPEVIPKVVERVSKDIPKAKREITTRVITKIKPKKKK